MEKAMSVPIAREREVNMKLTIPRGVLDEIRKGMSKAIPSRTTNRVYQHLKIESAPGKVRAWGADVDSTLTLSPRAKTESTRRSTCRIPRSRAGRRRPDSTGRFCSTE